MTLYDLALTASRVWERQGRYEAEAAGARLAQAARVAIAVSAGPVREQAQSWQLCQAPALTCCEAA
ncbi:MAG: hypothetical protein M1389_12485 [Chloroflexi bacterium]|nr:hypothetical protein [Chloroflexota bacterium]